MRKGKNMKRIFMFGYYGFNNIGDEAILEAIVEQFRRILPGVHLSALSYAAAETEKRYQIHAVSRNRFFQVFQSICKSDLVMSGGGSILQDVTSSRSMLYYLGIITLAKLAGKKVAFYGNGFGPVSRPFNKALARLIINRVDLITVRDEESKKVMESLGVHRNIVVTADAAFTLSVLSEKSAVTAEKPTVGISLRNWKGKENYTAAVAACADELVQRGYRVVFIPMQHPSDLIISNEVVSIMKMPAEVLQGKKEPKEMIAEIGKLDFLIGMRLHSLIFAAIAEVPMVGLSYESKITSFLKLVHQPCAGEVETMTEAQIKESVNQLIRDKKEYQNRLQEAKTELNQKAHRNATMIKEFMYRGEGIS